MDPEFKLFNNEKDNMRFKDIQRAQTKVLQEKRKGYNPFMKFGQVLKDFKQTKIYATEDKVPEFSSSEEDVNFENLTPRSNEIYQVTKEIKRSFKENDTPPKTKITFYRVSKIIGSGAFGKVNLAMHILARKLVAIKSIKKEYSRKPETKKKLLSEINILASLDNPYFVKLYDYFDDDKRTYLVTTFCEGGNLFDYLRKFKIIDETTCKLLFWNILEAIKALHSSHIVHRDIKPENVLICKNGKIKI